VSEANEKLLNFTSNGLRTVEQHFRDFEDLVQMVQITNPATLNKMYLDSLPDDIAVTLPLYISSLLDVVVAPDHATVNGHNSTINRSSVTVPFPPANTAVSGTSAPQDTPASSKSSSSSSSRSSSSVSSSSISSSCDADSVDTDWESFPMCPYRRHKHVTAALEQSDIFKMNRFIKVLLAASKQIYLPAKKQVNQAFYTASPSNSDENANQQRSSAHTGNSSGAVIALSAASVVIVPQPAQTKPSPRMRCIRRP